MRFLKLILWLIVLTVVIGGPIAWYLAGRVPGPTITIKGPSMIGRASTLEAGIYAEGLTRLDVTIEQKGQAIPVLAYDVASGAPNPIDLGELKLPIGKATQPQLVNGPAKITIKVAEKVFAIRTIETVASKDVTVRLDPPRVAVVSLHHFINLGGAEFVVIRATPEDVDAGIEVGDVRYPAYPGSAVGLTDPALRVGFFALQHDQDIDTRIAAYARDVAGNETTTPVERRPFVKKFLQSKIPIDQRFLDRVVPAIASNTPELKIDTGSPEGLLKGFLEINGNLRKKNNDTIAALAAKSQPKMLWKDAFAQMGNSQVESRFADRRTYFHDDKEIDRQVHLGFDLASVQQAPVHASNAGVVVFADYLGIYGNCVIVDHGLGVQSLYAHLSTMGVKPGDAVTKGQELGRTGATGLAGGDHLHFTMLLQGTPVNPVEWWDAHWLQDRVFRKIKEAGGS